MAERNIHTCQVKGCSNPGEEAHHCLHGRMKGVTELNQYENLQIVCRKCHHITGAAKTWENRVNYWRWACSWYGKQHMIDWWNDVPIKVKERYEEIE
jgi:uncharacterized protein YcsI (UPF0317 family)